MNSLMDALKEGHNLTLEKLSLLELLSRELKQGKNYPETLQKLEELIKYFNTEVEAHFRQEEIALFPVMEKFIGRAGFIHAMLEEHQSFWRALETLEERMDESLSLHKERKAKNAEVSSIEQVVAYIVAFLRSHITKEDKTLFPLVEKTLDPASQKELIQTHNVV